MCDPGSWWGWHADGRCASPTPSAGRLHAAGGDAELSEQFRLVEVQVEAGDLAFLEFVDAAEERVHRPAGRGPPGACRTSRSRSMPAIQPSRSLPFHSSMLRSMRLRVSPSRTDENTSL